ncbi:MAG: hypothetical protein RLY14_1304 [Planctomycetota bacterium]|jgi:HEAT repeat protein
MYGIRFSIIFLLLIQSSSFRLVEMKAVNAAEALQINHLSVTVPDLNAKWAMEDPVITLVESVDGLKSDEAIRVLDFSSRYLRAIENGFKVPDDLVSTCMTRLQAGEKDPKIRSGLVAILLRIGDSQTAELLWRIAQEDRYLQLAIETKLIELKSDLPKDQWRLRLKGGESRESMNLLACKGLAQVGDASDAASFESIIRDDTRSTPLRVCAAESLAAVDQAKALALAESMGADNQYQEGTERWDRWLAIVSLVRESNSDTALALTNKAFAEGSDAARTEAFKHIAKFRSEKAVPLLDDAKKDREVNVRLEAVRYLDTHFDSDAITRLAELVGDNNPNVRTAARDALLRHAEESMWSEAIQGKVTAALQSQKWWEVEQAAIMVASLKMTSAESQLFSLLKHERSEVYISAAWALRMVAESPEILQKILDYAKEKTDYIFQSSVLVDPEYHHVAHLFELIALKKLPGGKEMLQRFVVKNTKIGLTTRLSALWGVAQYLEKKPESEMSRAYAVIIADKFGPGAELDVVRYAAMVGMGYFADPTTKNAIMALQEGTGTPIRLAQDWALSRIAETEAAGKQ